MKELHLSFPRLGRWRVVACVATFTAAILFGLAVQGCATAAKSAAAIAATLKSAADINHSNQFESVQERGEIAGYIDAAAKANDVYVATLKAATAGKASPQSAVDAFLVFSKSIEDLETKGLLGLKNQQARDEFRDVMAMIDAEIAKQRSLVTQHASGKRWATGGVAMGLVLTPELIEELIALAVQVAGEGSVLVTKLMALKTQSDAEALDQAGKDDAAAEQVAEGDIAAAEAEAEGEEEEATGQRGEGENDDPGTGSGS